MSETKRARLVERGRNELNGGTYEIWDVGEGRGIYVDFCESLQITGKPETMAFPFDMRWPFMRCHSVKNWIELGSWSYDATGGKAIRDLGYEPVEEDENVTD